VSAAHRAGLRSTATLVYGRGESPAQIVAHLRTLADIQRETGGFTEFIPMPYVNADGAVTSTVDETRAIIAVSRIVLNGLIDHVQVAWTKVGLRTASLLLNGGADDMGGLLDAGPLFPSAGAEAGRTLTRADIEAVAGRGIRQRTTSYGVVEPRVPRTRTQLPVLQ
jgi:FO synthase